ncbi:MAG: WYL domain-containing protein [Lachnospiraceae bacterium]|nr:WYL domain-containing protein [Lachnospiraceae bacterium]
MLEFDSKLIGAVYDRFGEKVAMMPSGGDRVVATVDVQLSPTFWGWLFQFGRQMRVISPETVVKE